MAARTERILSICSGGGGLDAGVGLFVAELMGWLALTGFEYSETGLSQWRQRMHGVLCQLGWN